MTIGKIDFNNIDTTSKCYTIPNYSYWASSTLINDSYKLGVDKLQNVISNGKYNKLGLHGLTINWGGAEITINGVNKTINTTPDLLKAIQEASIIDSTISEDSNNAIKASVVNEAIVELENRITELENQLSYIGGESTQSQSYYENRGSITVNGSSVNPNTSTDYPIGTSLSLQVNPAGDADFNGWNIDGTDVQGNPYTFIVSKNSHTITAIFYLERRYLM